MPLPFRPRYVKVVEDNNILLVTFNRPEALNSMPPAMSIELSKVFRYYDTNPELFCAIVTGAGRAFSAGFDLKSAAGVAPSEDMQIDLTSGIDISSLPADSAGTAGSTGFAGLTERYGAEKPVIAAVNGVAFGGGFETALACDIILASENASFSLPEVRVGLFAAAAGVIRLPRLIGFQNAMSLILTGRRISAAEAKTLGIVQKLVPGGNTEVLQAAKDLALAITRNSPDSVQASLQVAKLSQGLTLKEALYAQSQHSAVKRMYKSPNSKEGPRAFSEKRPPKWQPPEVLPSRL